MAEIMEAYPVLEEFGDPFDENEEKQDSGR